jgi:hypothetical protein
MLKALEDLILYLIENWRSLTVQGALTAVVLIIVKRIGIRQLKKLLRLKDNAELERIEAKVERNEEMLKLLLKERGIVWTSIEPDGLKPARTPHIGSFFSLSQVGTQSGNQRRLKRMREYLKKLGRTKFQAFLLTTITNIALIIGYMLNVSDVQEMVGAWAPLVLAGSQLLAGAIYTWVEGGKDTAVVKLDTAVAELETARVEVRANGTAATNELNEFADNQSNR